MAIDFREVIETLIDIGFYDIFLPFILVYAVIFAILEKSRIFEKSDGDRNSRSVNAVIAFVFGLFVVASFQTVQYIQSLIINIILFVILILVTLIALGFIFGKDFFKHIFEGRDGKMNKPLIWSIGAIILIICLSIFLKVVGFWQWVDNELNFASSDFLTIVVVLAIIGVLFWITSGGDSTKSSSSSDDKKE